jgi:hypothetical protein
MLGIRVDVRFQDDLSAQCTGPTDNLIKVANLEPKQNAMARRCGIGVDKVGVIFFVPGMELKNESTTALHSIVHLAMGMFRKRIEPEQLPIPAAARANIADSD